MGKGKGSSNQPPRTPEEFNRWMNERHAVVSEQGRTVVITEETDPVLQRRVLLRSSFTDIRNLYSATHIEVDRGADGTPTVKRGGAVWLDSPVRRQYQGLVFLPGEETPGRYNLWNGFSVKPRKGDWTLMKFHVEHVICRGDPKIFAYVMAWMAAAVQTPGAPAEVALVLRGRPGTGKGVFAREFGAPFGQHFLHINNPRHLMGNFNAHLQDAVVVFADEAVGTWDPASMGTLKALITEPTIPIERKGVDVVLVKNVIHLIMASNEEWVVPVGVDERRYCVLDVSDEVMEDHDYFAQLTADMRDGGRAAMLYDLLHHDYSAVNLRRAPETDALREQKILSLPARDRWLFGRLMDGRLGGKSLLKGPEIGKQEVHEDYSESVRQTGQRGTLSTETELGMYFAKVFGSRLQSTRPSRIKKRVKCWIFPPLRECRELFDAYTRSHHPWPPEEPDPGPQVSAMPIPD